VEKKPNKRKKVKLFAVGVCRLYSG